MDLGFVERAEVAQQYTRGPTVADDVVCAENDGVEVVPLAQDERSRRVARQIERLVRLVLEEARARRSDRDPGAPRDR